MNKIFLEMSKQSEYRVLKFIKLNRQSKKDLKIMNETIK